VGGLTAPVLNRSAIKAEFKSANAYQIEALYNYHKTVLLSYTEVYNELNKFNNLRQISEQKSEEVSVLTRSIETSTELYKTGRANYLEVLLTQQNTFNAKLDLVNTLKRQLISTVSLYKALGGGWK
jgi:outer membrane protein TolC